MLLKRLKFVKIWRSPLCDPRLCSLPLPLQKAFCCAAGQLRWQQPVVSQKFFAKRKSLGQKGYNPLPAACGP